MNLTLYLTENCNMNCSYCPSMKRQRDMSLETLKAACDFAFQYGAHGGLCFFGGEPLLKKDLIYAAVSYCQELSEKTGKPFMTKMTTNGLLLEDEFLAMAKRIHMEIGLSFEGTVQDACRVYAGGGGGTFDMVEEKAKLLLSYLPDSYAMMTIAPEAVEGFAEAVRYLYDLGFYRVNAVPAYGPKVNWTEEAMDALEAQLEQIATLYEAFVISEKRFHFGTFDSKIKDCITGENPSKRCHLGLKQMPISVDGKIYPCTQFVGDPDYCMGDVFTGLRLQKQKEIADRSREPQGCRDCAIADRCTNSCGCANRLETGSENQVSATQCRYEQTLIRISDELAEKLYTAHQEAFVAHIFGKK